MAVEGQKDTGEIGPFRILRRLRGSSRDVFLAESKEKGRAVLKVYGAPRKTGLFDPEIADAASAYARLTHPNIVRVIDLFSTDQKFVIALEYVDGSTLNVVGAALERSKLTLDDAACFYVAHCIFSALAAAHEASLLHRNINPSNVHVAWDGSVKLGNFNVAPTIRIPHDSSPGFTWGSYGYFAPEQVRVEPLDARSDVYSAMVIVWELLARKKAIRRGQLQDFELLKAMVSPTFEPLEKIRPDLDPAIAFLVCRGMALDANDRPTAAEAAAAFEKAIGAVDARARLVAALAAPRGPAPNAASVEPPKTPAISVHDAPTVAPPAPEEEELPSIDLQSLPPPPGPPGPPPIPPMPPPMRSPMASMSTSRAFPPPPAPGSSVVPPPLEAAPPPPAIRTMPVPRSLEAMVPPIAAPPPAAPAIDPPTSPALSLDVSAPSPLPLPPRRRMPWAILAGAAAIGIFGGIGLVAFWRTKTHAPVVAAATAPPTVTTAAPEPTVTPEPTPTAPPIASAVATEPPPAPPPADTTPATTAKPATTIPVEFGEIVLPQSAAGHRVFVDGRVLGDGSKPIRVKCGHHTVKIGSGGRSQPIDVPCGDALQL